MNPGLRLPADGAQALVDHVRVYGRQGVETGAMLLTAPGDTLVTTVAIAGTTGVIRKPGLFVLTMPVIEVLFSYAEQQGLQARAQVHSHGGNAFLSRTDREGGIRMPGFIAAVVPTFRTPPPDPRQWGWWAFTDGDWCTNPPGELDEARQACIITVDADGVR
jgi:proteasome lid subunit RPN8/RPN11